MFDELKNLTRKSSVDEIFDAIDDALDDAVTAVEDYLIAWRERALGYEGLFNKAQHVANQGGVWSDVTEESTDCTVKDKPLTKEDLLTTFYEGVGGNFLDKERMKTPVYAKQVWNNLVNHRLTAFRDHLAGYGVEFLPWDEVNLDNKEKQETFQVNSDFFGNVIDELTRFYAKK